MVCGVYLAVLIVLARHVAAARASCGEWCTSRDSAEEHLFFLQKEPPLMLESDSSDVVAKAAIDNQNKIAMQAITSWIEARALDSWKENLSNVEAADVLNISLCVPAAPGDLDALKTVLMPSVRVQTSQPAEVIVAASETDSVSAQLLEAELQLLAPSSTRVRVVGNPAQAYAGANRNRAANESVGNLIVFMDADDAMHPKRLELLSYTFSRYRPKLILHGYSPGVSAIATLPQTFSMSHVRSMHEVDELWKTKYLAHQGQPAVDPAVFRRLQQSDSPRGQDKEFLADVFDTYGSGDDVMAYIGLPLTRFGNHKSGR